MANAPDSVSMALFCDFENVALGVRDAKYEKFDIRKVLERLLLKGSIVVKKAYCDWDRYREFKAQMHEASFELIEIPHVRQSGKNSADIRMVVDALDLCYTKSHVDTFVIISGDSDFSPLVSKLRENNKTVIGVGVKGSTSDLLTANCDEFIFYDDLVRESRRRATRTPARAPNGRSGAGSAPGGTAAPIAGTVANANAPTPAPAAPPARGPRPAPSVELPAAVTPPEAAEPDGGSVSAANDAAPARKRPSRRRKADIADTASSVDASIAAPTDASIAPAPTEQEPEAGSIDAPVAVQASLLPPAAPAAPKPAPRGRRRKPAVEAALAEEAAPVTAEASVELGLDLPPAAAPEAGPAPRNEDERRQHAIDLVIETVEALITERGADDKIWGSMVKQTLKRRRPGFAEGYYGYRSFNELLEDARDRGLLALEHDEKSGGYVIRLM